MSILYNDENVNPNKQDRKSFLSKIKKIERVWKFDSNIKMGKIIY
jgi:hypothetical protein